MYSEFFFYISEIYITECVKKKGIIQKALPFDYAPATVL